MKRPATLLLFLIAGVSAHADFGKSIKDIKREPAEENVKVEAPVAKPVEIKPAVEATKSKPVVEKKTEAKSKPVVKKPVVKATPKPKVAKEKPVKRAVVKSAKPVQAKPVAKVKQPTPYQIQMKKLEDRTYDYLANNPPVPPQCDKGLVYKRIDRAFDEKTAPDSIKQLVNKQVATCEEKMASMKTANAGESDDGKIVIDTDKIKQSTLGFFKKLKSGVTDKPQTGKKVCTTQEKMMGAGNCQ